MKLRKSFHLQNIHFVTWSCFAANKISSNLIIVENFAVMQSNFTHLFTGDLTLSKVDSPLTHQFVIEVIMKGPIALSLNGVTYRKNTSVSFICF